MVGEVRSKRDMMESSESKSTSQAVVSTVAERSGADPIELPPLHDTIDPEALDSLFVGDVDGRVEFRYYGFDVVVHSDGRVTVR